MSNIKIDFPSLDDNFLSYIDNNNIYFFKNIKIKDRFDDINEPPYITEILGNGYRYYYDIINREYYKILYSKDLTDNDAYEENQYYILPDDNQKYTMVHIKTDENNNFIYNLYYTNSIWINGVNLETQELNSNPAQLTQKDNNIFICDCVNPELTNIKSFIFKQLSFNENNSYQYVFPYMNWKKFYTYKIGDIVKYNNRFFKCIKNIEKENKIKYFPYSYFIELTSQELYPKNIYVLLDVECVDENNGISYLMQPFDKSFYSDNGWKYSDARIYLNNILIRYLPKKVRDNIKEVLIPNIQNAGLITTNNIGPEPIPQQQYYIDYTKDKLFLLSQREVQPDEAKVTFIHPCEKEGNYIKGLPQLVAPDDSSILNKKDFISFTRSPRLRNRRDVWGYCWTNDTESTDLKYKNSTATVNNTDYLLRFAFCL